MQLRCTAGVIVLAFMGFQLLRADEPGLNMVDRISQESVVFTPSEGTVASREQDGSIVFSGQLSTPLKVDKSVDGFASIWMLIQFSLYSEPPLIELLEESQGAALALSDEVEGTEGTMYGLGSDDADPPQREWVQLLWEQDGPEAEDTPVLMQEDDAKYMLFRFNYGDGEYQIFVGDEYNNLSATKPLNAPWLKDKGGFSDLELSGNGKIMAMGSTSGKIDPLSSSIGFSVYADASGVLFVLDTVDEQDSGEIKVWARLGDEWVVVGTTPADGSGHYQFYAIPGLLQGGDSYRFKVEDELGNTHFIDRDLKVSMIKMESITMTPDVMIVQFNSEAGLYYRIISAETLDAQEWESTAVYYPDANGEYQYGAEQFLARGPTTTVKIPRNASRAFFKVQQCMPK